MAAKNITLEFSSALLDIVEKNPSFDAARLRIAYTGKNRNHVYISKESFERAIPTMFNCPVVANYKREENQIGSHDGEFIKDKDGQTKYVNITQPIGCIPESATWDWEIVEDNGVIHQYLCADVLLWKRQEAYQFIKDSGVVKQSMEIFVTDGESEDEYFNVKDFCFTAFCLLGDAEPCFESAALFTFSKDDFTKQFKEQYTEMMHELKATFGNTEVQKEGKKDLNKLNELLEKYNLKEEDLSFDYAELSDEELEAKFAELYDSDESAEIEDEDLEETTSEEENPDTEENNDSDVEDNTDDTADFALNSQIAAGLREALSVEMISEEWGEYPRYWMVDFDVEISEVYFHDSEEDGKLYGCKFRMDGDNVIIDFETKKKKKFAIVDYVEGTEDQTLEAFKLIDDFNRAYIRMKNTFENNDAELHRLQEFEAKILKERREADEAELFKKFESQLEHNDDFEVLKENASNYSISELEKELFVLVGKMNFAVNDNKDANKTPTIVTSVKEDTKDEFGGLFAWKNEEK